MSEGLAMFTGALALGLEGIVAKDSESPYVEGPRVTWHWQKVKNREYLRKEKVVSPTENLALNAGKAHDHEATSPQTHNAVLSPTPAS